MNSQSVVRRGRFARAEDCTADGWMLFVDRIAGKSKMRDGAFLSCAACVIAAVMLLSCSSAASAAESRQAASLAIDAKAALMAATSLSGAEDAKVGAYEATSLRGRNAYFLQPRDVVLFLGNSITELAKPQMEFLMADLRRQYSTLAEGAGRVTLVLAGRSGEQAHQGAGRVKALIDRHKPTVCVVSYGTCEVTFKNQKSFIPAMKAIIRQLKDAGVAVTIVSPPPASAKNWKQGGQWPASQFVEGLPEMVAQASQVAAEEGLLFADAFASLTAYTEGSGREFTTDGIHLNANGYRVMADALQESWDFGKPLIEAEKATAYILPAPRVVSESTSNGRSRRLQESNLYCGIFINSPSLSADW